MASALSNLRVLDFSRVLAGPLATMVLGDLGADVLKIERPDGGDDTRAWGPPYDAAGESTYFQAANRNKRACVIDLADARGRDRAQRLAKRADVVVENFRPGTMERLGLSYADIESLNPTVIYCSITGFARGEGAAFPGYDLLVQALGGLMSVTGEPDGEPQKVGVALVDVIAGLFAAIGILAAVHHRERTGRGQRVEVDLLSSLLAALVNQGTAYTSAGEVPERMGNGHPSIAPYEVFRAKDRDVVIAVGNDRQFQRLCEHLGLEELARDSRFSVNKARVENRRELREALAAAVAGLAAGPLVDRLLAVGVPAGPVNDIGEAFALADRLGLSPLIGFIRSDGSELQVTRSPIRLSLTPPRHDLPPPSWEAALRGVADFAS